MSDERRDRCYNTGAMVLPRVTVTLPAIKRLRNHDCWVFRDELVRPDRSIAPGDVVEAVSERGEFIAYAFFHPTAHIALRAVSLSASQPIDRTLLEHRLDEAIARRRDLTGTNARRVVFSEADGLPGLIVDQYDRYLVVQFRAAGMDRRRDEVLELLAKRLRPKGVLERSDKEFRDDEGLPIINHTLMGTVPEQIEIEEDGLRFLVDPHRGHKTGFYLDQRTARRRLRALVRPGWRVLDAFAYTGAFGVVAASQGAQVTCLEQHEPLIETARAQAERNGVADRMEFVAGNAFYWLEAKTTSPQRFDLVLLDPPALAKSKAEIAQGRSALHHLLINGLGLVKDGGLFVVSLCTYHLLTVTEEMFRIAAAKRGVKLYVRDQWPQAEDHPWLLQIPPTRYLMSWVLAPGARSTD